MPSTSSDMSINSSFLWGGFTQKKKRFNLSLLSRFSSLCSPMSNLSVSVISGLHAFCALHDISLSSLNSCLQSLHLHHQTADIQPVQSQGGCSYTLVLRPRSPNAPPRIWQLRPLPFALDPEIYATARRIHGALVPALLRLDALTPDAQLIETSYIRGVPLSNPLHRLLSLSSSPSDPNDNNTSTSLSPLPAAAPTTDPSSAVLLLHLRPLLHDLAHFFAQTWTHRLLPTTSTTTTTLSFLELPTAENPRLHLPHFLPLPQPRPHSLPPQGKVGRTLAWRLRQLAAKLPSARLRARAREVCDAVLVRRALRALPLVLTHGDVLPGNFLVGRRWGSSWDVCGGGEGNGGGERNWDGERNGNGDGDGNRDGGGDGDVSGGEGGREGVARERDGGARGDGEEGQKGRDTGLEMGGEWSGKAENVSRGGSSGRRGDSSGSRGSSSSSSSSGEEPVPRVLSGVVDWAEAEWLPFGIGLHGLEQFWGFRDYGRSAGGRWRWRECAAADRLRAEFWENLVACIPALSRPDVRQRVELARDVGVLLWHGFAWDQGRIDRVVDNGDWEEVELLEAFLGVREEGDALTGQVVARI